MAVQSGGTDLYNAQPKKKVKKGRTDAQKRAARTTESSRARYDAKHPQRPVAPRTGPLQGPLHRQAEDLANLRYGGMESELTQRGQSIAPWFQDYQNQITAQRAQSQQYQAPIVQQSQQRQQEAGQVAAGVDPTSEAGKEATLAAAARAALEGSFTSLLQGQGQVQDNYMAGRGAVGATAQIGEQQRLTRDRSDVAREKGLYQSTALEDLKDKRHTQALENAAYGVDLAKVQQSAASDRADRRADRRKANQTINQYGYSAKDWAALTPAQRQTIMAKVKADGRAPKAVVKPKPAFTPLQRTKTKASIRSGAAAVRAQVTSPSYSGPEGFFERAYNGLVQEKNYDPILARAVVQVLKFGKVKPALAKKIARDYGVKNVPTGKKLHLPPSPSQVPVVGNIIGQVLG